MLQEVDEEFVESLATELDERGIEAVAISFLHSFANPDNENAARRAGGRAAPGMRVSISSEVAPEIREYERSSTTIANVYVQPLAERYLSGLCGRQDISAKRRRWRIPESGWARNCMSRPDAWWARL